MPKPRNQISSEEALLAALAVRFRPPEFAFVSQVRAGMGMVSHTADAVAIGLSVPRGLELHGFELKTNRTDWMAEKHNPEKSDPICRFCDRWWLVVGDAAIVRPGELPPTWGLLVPDGDRLVVAVEAPKRDADPVDKSFVAAFMRRVTTAFVSEQTVRERISEAMQRAERTATGDAQRELESLQSSVSRFEKHSGVSIHGTGHDAADVGRAVRAVLASSSAVANAASVLRSASGLVAHAQAVIRAASEDMRAAGIEVLSVSDESSGLDNTSPRTTDEKRYGAMEKDVFNATVPFGSHARWKG